MALATFEEQLDFLGDTISTTAGLAQISGGTGIKYYITIDWSKYTGVTGFYFEAGFKISVATATATCALYDVTSGTPVAVTGGSVTTSVVQYSRGRTAAITGQTGVKTYCVFLGSSISSATATLSACRLIITQDATATTKRAMRLIATSDSTAATTGTLSAFTNRFLYTAANWDGTPTFYLGATVGSSSTQTTTLQLRQVSNGTIAGSVTIASATTAYVVSSAMTLVDGAEYDIYMFSNTAGTAYHGNAHLIVDQTNYNRTELWVQPAHGSLNGALLTNGVGAARLDPTLFGATSSIQAFPEAYLKATNPNTTDAHLALNNASANTVTGTVIATSSTTLVRVRNAAITTPAANTEYVLEQTANTTTNNALRLIVLIQGIPRNLALLGVGK